MIIAGHGEHLSQRHGTGSGASLVENDLLKDALEVLDAARARGVQVYLPVDFVVAERLEAGVATKVVARDKVPRGWIAFDVGPESQKQFAEALQGRGHHLERALGCLRELKASKAAHGHGGERRQELAVSVVGAAIRIGPSIWQGRRMRCPTSPPARRLPGAPRRAHPAGGEGPGDLWD